MKKLLIIALIHSFILSTSLNCLAQDDIRLMIPEFKEGEKASPMTGYYYKSFEDGKGEYSEININEFLNKFKGYDVEQIEVWIEGKIQSGSVTKLFVSAEGAGGIKLVLKPKK